MSHEVVVNLIGATTTRTGLRVQSQLDTNRYPAGRTVSDDELESIYLRRDSFHGEWNYSLLPRVALLLVTIPNGCLKTQCLPLCKGEI